MCKNEFFQNLGKKNELLKIQGWKTNFIQSLRMKTIVYPINFVYFLFILALNILLWFCLYIIYSTLKKIKKMMCQDSNGKFKYRIEFKFNYPV